MAKKASTGKPPPSAAHVVATNRKASFQYHLLEKFEAGLMLTGSEVKSLREGQANLLDAYVVENRGEMFLYHAHIAPYTPANQFNHEPRRTRKLLMQRREIERLLGKMREKGLTLIPTRIYFKRGRAKCEIALAKGKALHDKRQTIKKRETNRELRRAMKR